MPERDDRSSRIEKELFLRSLQFTRTGRATGMGAIAETMAARMRTAVFPAGTTLYRAGEAAQFVYFIKRGLVELRKDGEEPWIFRDREIIGILDVMKDQARGRSAVATTDTVALVVGADDWFEILEDNFDVTRNAISNIARGLHDLSLQLPPTGGFPLPSPDDTDVRPIHSLDTVERIIALRDIPLLVRAGVQSLTDLAASLEERRLAAGDVLFRSGDPSEGFFLVGRGLVEIGCENPTIRAGFGPGEVVGGYGAIALNHQAFDAAARIPSLVYRLGLEEYYDLMEDHFELARALFAQMAVAREDLLRRVAERKRLTGGAQDPALAPARVLSSAG